MAITTFQSSAEDFAPYEAKWNAIREQLALASLEGRRKAWDEAPLALPDNAPVAGEDVEISHRLVPVRDGTEIELRILRSLKVKGDGKSVLFLVMHGGGWVSGGHNIEEATSRFIANIPNVVVVSVDYRLAPEHKFPTGLNDCFDVLLWCKENAAALGIDPERIIVGGSSAGANLAAALTLMTLSPETKTSGIIAQYISHPSTCHPEHQTTYRYEFPSMEDNAHAPVLTKEDVLQFWNQYVTSSKDGANIFASPILASKALHSKLPRTRIVASRVDPLYSEGLNYHQALEEAGVDVDMQEYPGLPHCFYLETKVAHTKPYFARVVEFVKKVVSEA